jgi:hypothetical protein
MTQEFDSAITEGRESLTGAAAGAPLASLLEVAERSWRSPGAGIRL